VSETDGNERLRDALEKIDKWAEAYPIEVFQEPDWERAEVVLREAGMSLTAISAANMRFVLQGVQKIAREALEAAA